MRRRTFLAATGSVSLAALSGCASVVEAAFGEGEQLEVAVEGELQPPISDLYARHAGYGYYVLGVRVVDGAGRCSIDISHAGVSNEETDGTISASETSAELDVNSDGPYEVTVTSSNRGAVTVGVVLKGATSTTDKLTGGD